MTWGRREELLDIEVQRKEQIESERQEAHHEQQLARDELGGLTSTGPTTPTPNCPPPRN